jgi:L,D-peptidoglycan transpeptidase YkuD (ErfK/YbiS/YcfS/YnhG family)
MFPRMGKRARFAPWIGIIGMLGVSLLLLTRSQAAAPVDCSSFQSNVLVVDTDAHRLSLCASGASIETFSVRLGRNGVGKAREGDGKTPYGRYPLADPRASTAYGTFIPIGYPTDAQHREGYTGSAVGVHGPHRRMLWAGQLVNVFDTTDGCIGIATDAEMTRLAAWVRRTRVVEIVLR